jgi:deoxycytidylate deaminase
MGKLAKQLFEEPEVKPKGRTVSEKLKNTYTDELVLGICTHIGSQRDVVVKLLKEKLEQDYCYQVEIIRLSDFITQFYKEPNPSPQDHTLGYTQLKYKIDGGDYLRKQYNSNSLLAELAINKILVDRALAVQEEKVSNGIQFDADTKIEDTEMHSRRVCYIIDSLKNKEELEILRTVYRDIFYLFSIYTPSEERVQYLIDKTNGLSKEEAKNIIETDEYENIGDHGQNVRDTFVDADFFIRSSKSNKKNLNDSIERYLNLIFDTQIITPSPNETAMYFAKSAAGNSACLSRQVGATITDSDGVVIAQGWNDVPRFGGNLYRDSDKDSQKCYLRGECKNVTHKNEIIEDILSKIKDSLDSTIEADKEKNTLTLVQDKNQVIMETIGTVIRDSKFKSIIEYSRSIHAEMHAIVIGSQMTGNKMINGDLYCTTYPCHNCARHIVLAGIKNIYYIEPYKKSLCLTLHDDSLTEDENEIKKVRILPYDGVSPRRYLQFFSMIKDERKNDDGTLKSKVKSIAYPKKRLSLQSLPTLESQAVIALEECGILTKYLE